ncbi:MAG: oxaloacetate decarboxylase subunit alpha [Firmicutes bacterium]|nr:oxaloacetate decarboxylase subunit alpha [Bacillota bacterium]
MSADEVRNHALKESKAGSAAALQETPAPKRRIKVTDTIFRDAHQSLLATRMRTEDMLAVADEIDKVGYYSLEVWGGATFDSCLRYLDEDPWVRLRKLKERIKNTPLQMLLRGQNLLGYRQYPDDVVREFIKLSIANGIDIMRIFDALNDVRNMQVAIEATKREGGHAQASVVYTTSPVHNLDLYVKIARALRDMGADSICIKDMAGLLTPYAAYELVKRLKEEIALPVHLHSHYTNGLAAMAYLKGIEAGADGIDTALSALALGSSQPATETMVATLQGTPYDTELDLSLISSINSYFKGAKEKYAKVAAPVAVNPEGLIWQIPGGMLSNLRAQLKAQGMLDKLPAVLDEVPRVREEMGYPPLVTPMSQIVGTQAVLNIATGKRYAIKSKEIRDYVKGLYGTPPAPINDDIRRMIIGDEEVVTCRPADLLEPQLEKAEAELGDYMQSQEDLLSYVLFPEVAMDFFKKREQVQEEAQAGA